MKIVRSKVRCVEHTFTYTSGTNLNAYAYFFFPLLEK
jgi:hypothetical protein